MIWNTLKEKPMPRGETFIFIKHLYGVDYINYNSGAFRYCYSGVEVPITIIENISHWGDPNES